MSGESSMCLRMPQLGASFRKEDVFGLGRAVEQFLDAREGALCRDGAGFDGVAGAFEIVPGKMLHVGPQNQIRVAFPGFKLMLLRGADGAGHDLEDVFGSAVAAVLNADGNREHSLGADLARRDGRHLRDEATVGKAARADFDRLEQAGKGAARANGVGQVALREDDRIERGEVGRHHGQGNAQLLKLACFENMLH